MNVRQLSFSRTGLLAAILFLAVAAPPGRAQCSLQVQPGEGLPGINGTVSAAIVWDPDAGGPLAPLIVVGGTFALAGSVVANNIAAYDTATGVWSALGSGTSGGVGALGVLATGQLVAGGQFMTAGGVAASRVATWDGSSWLPLGAGVNGVVGAFLTLANGDLIVGGAFTLAGGTQAQGVARWDGTTWAPLGAPAGLNGDGGVGSLVALPNGDLVAGGGFSVTFGAVSNRVARFDGTTWSPMGAGMNRAVYSLHLRPNGELLAGGEFTMVGTSACNRIARWNGSAWLPLGSGVAWSLFPPVASYVADMVSLPGGDVLVGGVFTIAGGVPVYCVARWNGSTWSADAQGPAGVHVMCLLPGGYLVTDGHAGTSVAMWNGTAWIAMGAGIGSSVLAAAALPGGDAVVGGSFTVAGGQSCNRIARWSGGAWSPLGTGMNGQVQAIAPLPNGDLLAGGAFTVAGGVTANRVARWNGTTWTPLGTGFTAPYVAEVHSLLPLPNGDVIAGGWLTDAGGTALNNVARWNGTTWSSLGSGMSNLVLALARMPNGDIVAGGVFTTAGGVPANYIARWNGSSWLPMGAGMNGSVDALAVRPDGQLVAVGDFTTAGGVSAQRAARWDGTNWWPLGTGPNAAVSDVAVLPNGDLIVVGHFAQAGGLSASRLARYSATGWSALGLGVTGSAPFVNVNAVEALSDGTVLIGGMFDLQNGSPAANVVALTPSCPATAVAYGSGCAGAGGTNQLTAATLPWLGSTFRAQATGMPPIGIVASVYGFTQAAVPLAALLPQGLPGCMLHATPDIVDAMLPGGGMAETAVALPISPSLVGASFFHFVVVFEGDGQGIAAITSSNGIAAVLGAL